MNLYEKPGAESLGESVLHSLQRKIISGELKSGDWLPPEREMAEQMGISRGSLHQAILALEYQGFVSIIPRKGTVVCDYRKHPTPQSLAVLMSYSSAELDKSIFIDMMDYRIWMERECARLACTNIYDSTLLEMGTIASSLCGVEVDVVELIFRFHYLLTQASGNSIFSMIFRGFEPAVRSLTQQSFQTMGTDLKETAQLMKELVHCIEIKDEAAAETTVVRLLSHGIDQLKSRYI
ncbi:MAG: FadR family transcriptional regulator [Oscillospiraceae bacterium]|nr:FadR family transcriptional regulator [Oscillospiraceae bacterium]